MKEIDVSQFPGYCEVADHFQYIAVDDDGYIYAYKQEPVFDGEVWSCGGCCELIGRTTPPEAPGKELYRI